MKAFKNITLPTLGLNGINYNKNPTFQKINFAVTINPVNIRYILQSVNLDRYSLYLYQNYNNQYILYDDKYVSYISESDALSMICNKGLYFLYKIIDTDSRYADISSSTDIKTNTDLQNSFKSISRNCIRRYNTFQK